MLIFLKSIERPTARVGDRGLNLQSGTDDDPVVPRTFKNGSFFFRATKSEAA